MVVSLVASGVGDVLVMHDGRMIMRTPLTSQLHARMGERRAVRVRAEIRHGWLEVGEEVRDE